MDVQIKLVYKPGDKNKNDILNKLEELDLEIFYDDNSFKAKRECYWWIAYMDDVEVGFAGMKSLRPLENGVFFCRAGVLLRYRKGGIHKKLILARERYAKTLEFKTAITYVMSANIASLNNLIKRGWLVYSPEFAWAGRDDGPLYFYKQMDNGE